MYYGNAEQFKTMKQLLMQNSEKVLTVNKMDASFRKMEAWFFLIFLDIQKDDDSFRRVIMGCSRFAIFFFLLGEITFLTFILFIYFFTFTSPKEKEIHQNNLALKLLF